MRGTSGRRLWPSEILLTDLVGRLIEFWGFKRNMGRVWAVLYLSPAPLAAADIQEALQLSIGAVSMTLAELGRWGVVKKIWVPGERRDHYAAEVQLWKMVSRVMAEREGGEIAAAIDACERALASLAVHLEAADAEERARAELQKERIETFLGAARMGKQLLDMLLATAKLDAGPLVKAELGKD